MIKQSSKYVYMLVVFTLMAVTVRSATLVSYDFTGAANNSLSVAPTTIDSVALVSNPFIVAAGLNNGGATTIVGNQVMNATVLNANAGSLATAITNNDYFSFKLTPQTGYSIDLSSISFVGWTTTDSSPNFAAKNYNVLSSVGGFTSGASITSGTLTVQDGGYPGSPDLINVDLSSASFDAITSETEFRIYVWGGTGFGQGTRFDNFVVDGVATVPEPSTYALLASGLFGLVLLRKRAR